MLVLVLMARLATSVKSMHRRKVIHRDLKLANICIDKNFNPFIVDFGHAVQADSKSDLHEYPIGTRGCRCPEYAESYPLIKEGRNPRNYPYNAEKFDVFSLGVVYFLLLSGGSRPFLRANKEDPSYSSIIQKDFVSFWQRADQHCRIPVKPEARGLLEGMLAADPAERFTMSQVLHNEYLQKVLVPVDAPAAKTETIESHPALEDHSSEKSQGTHSDCTTSPAGSVDRSKSNSTNKSMKGRLLGFLRLTKKTSQVEGA